MKTLIFSITYLLIGYAYAEMPTKCAEQAAFEAVKHNVLTSEVSTNSRGVRSLELSSFWQEGYVVGISDEVGSRDYLVMMNQSDCSLNAIVLIAEDNGNRNLDLGSGRIPGIPECFADWGSPDEIACE